MSRYSSAIALCLAILPAAPASAGDGLTLSANSRVRFEAIEGDARAGTNPSDQWTSLRTIAHADWRQGPWQIVGEAWDSRVWGGNAGNPPTSNDVNTFEPVQAYVRYDAGAALGRGSKTSLQAGRMALNIGSRRLIASDDYRNTTNAYTGVLAETALPSGVALTGFYILPQTRLPDDTASVLDRRQALDKESLAAVLWGGLLAHQAKGNPLMAELSFIHFGERDAPGHPTKDRSLNNLGLRLLSDPRVGHVDAGVEGIYQWGSTSASTAAGAAHMVVSASFLRAHAGYSFAGKAKPRLLAEFDRASGDAPGGSNGRFDTLFGMRRGDLAPSGLYNAVGRTNILSAGLRLEVTPSRRTDAFIGWRGLWLAERRDSFSSTGVKDATGASGDFAGHQVDARLRHWLMPKHLRLELDGVWLARGRFLESAPNGRLGNTRYVSVSLTAFL